MNYAAWIQENHDRGVRIETIAAAALDGPVMVAGGVAGLRTLLDAVADILGIAPQSVYVVGSARYGFSLRDGSAFDPAFSDLDLAVVDRDIYHRCAGSAEVSPDGARFPERDFPADARVALRERIDVLSRSVAGRFAYVSVAVFPGRAALARAQAQRIRIFLDGDKEGAAWATVPADAAAVEQPFRVGATDLQTLVTAGLPWCVQSVATSTPVNTSPWVTDIAALLQVLGTSSHRQARLLALRQSLGDLAGVVDVQCCLLGGSFIDAANPAPNDLDVVVFYRAPPVMRFDPGRTLQRLARKFRLKQIDMRFVPCDSEPWLMVKLTSFFTTLYQLRRPGEQDRAHGLILLLPERAGAGKAEPCTGSGNTGG